MIQELRLFLLGVVLVGGGLLAQEPVDEDQKTEPLLALAESFMPGAEGKELLRLTVLKQRHAWAGGTWRGSGRFGPWPDQVLYFVADSPDGKRTLLGTVYDRHGYMARPFPAWSAGAAWSHNLKSMYSVIVRTEGPDIHVRLYRFAVGTERTVFPPEGHIVPTKAVAEMQQKRTSERFGDVVGAQLLPLQKGVLIVLDRGRDDPLYLRHDFRTREWAWVRMELLPIRSGDRTGG